MVGCFSCWNASFQSLFVPESARYGCARAREETPPPRSDRMIPIETPSPPSCEEPRLYKDAQEPANLSLDIEAKWHSSAAADGVLPVAVFDSALNAEPMKVILRSQSQDTSYMEYPSEIFRFDSLCESAASPIRGLSLPELWCGYSDELDMLTDPSLYWSTFQPINLSMNAEFSPNPGSLLHDTGRCSPCAWYWKPSGCSNGTGCKFCHLCPEGELKARRKLKLAAMRCGALTPKAPGQKQQTMKDAGVLSLSSLV